MSETSCVDWKLFDPQAIDPETAAFNRKIEEELAAAPFLYTLEPQVIRDAREAGQSIFGPIKRSDEARTRRVPGPAGEIPIRVFIPEQVRGIYLHIHGGGFVLNRADHYDEAILRVGKACQVAVVSVDYRLAPENRYPAAPDDCEAVAVWLAAHGGSEFGSEQLMIGGESAGATLAAVTLLRLRDRHHFTKFGGAVLNYGIYDLTLTPSSRRWGERNLVLTTKLLEWFHKNYAPAEKYTDPDISPLYADLSGLPPALFTIGTLDPLLDDSLFMHMRWRAAGNASELAIYPGGIHAFNAFPIAIADRANRRMEEFIVKAVSRS
ncbi:MAG: alpha/beta hydrolase [Desulfobacterales bacterium]|nr:MAG: alpha/beta hydrolase [Desulfobacterales bacterium]